MTKSNRLLIKVCGMKEPKNIQEVEALSPDFMGFIAYPPSKRFIGNDFQMPVENQSIERVLVVVNEDVNTVDKLATVHGISTIQLHGAESPEFCEQLLKSGYKVWKAFAIDQQFDFTTVNEYEPFCSTFVFDTKGKLPGGNGAKFDWQILENYHGTTPFLLSGGISLADVDQIKEFSHPKLAGVDVNSGFESEPGVKIVSEVEEFIAQLR